MDLPGTSFGSKCTATYDGGVVGISFLENKIVKLDASGTLQWAFQIDTSAVQYLTLVTETADHGIVVAGSYSNYAASVAFKLDENGNLLWQKRFDPTGQGLTVHYLCPTHNDGGFLIGGGECAMQFYVIRCDAQGDIVWQKQYFGLTTAPTGFFRSFVQAPDGGYVGVYSRLESGDLDWGLLKIDSAGSPLWAKAFDEANERDETIDAVATQAGGVAVLGTTTNYQAPNNENKMTLTVFDGSGNLISYRVFDFTEQLQPRAMTQTNDGGYVLTGSTFSLNTLVVKTDGFGSIQWQKLGVGAASQEGMGVAPAPGDMFYLSAHDFTHKATIAKLSALTGQGICTEDAIQLSPASHTATLIPLTAASNVATAVASPINYPHHSDNTPAAAVCAMVAAEQPLPGYVLQCSPNPFAGQLHVDLGQAASHDGTLKLYDLQGRMVAQTTVAAGTQRLDWALPALAAGVFSLKFETTGYVETVKLVKLRE